ncbi:hypothetical protein TorRG33x02_290630 [Trema orientale]|uniref:Uncharacterized protein n=1 Tax=Trema orientale TaxID=63057 RepID=A0A2P5CC20_TREOI|nr:hypothetical protein TorRG33x02_290630 [Trema orientale]
MAARARAEMYVAQDGCVGRDLIVGARDVDVAARASGRSRVLGGGGGHLGWRLLGASRLSEFARVVERKKH